MEAEDSVLRDSAERERVSAAHAGTQEAALRVPRSQTSPVLRSKPSTPFQCSSFLGAPVTMLSARDHERVQSWESPIPAPQELDAGRWRETSVKKAVMSVVIQVL